ncbi:MAG: type VI secretion system tip protein TssI/VgrG [Myxococcota bacterium]
MTKNDMRQNAELLVAERVGLEVRTFRVEQRMSDIFSIHLSLLAEDGDIDLESIVGKTATLSISGHFVESEPRRWSGVLRSIAQTRVERTRLGLSGYEATVVPRLWLLTQRRNNRHFQHVSIPEIARRLLDEWKVTADWRIQAADYPNLELRVQYDETDFTFFSRLLEEAGIAFYFEHDGAHDSRLVLDDRPHQNAPRTPPVAFVDQIDEAHRSGVDWANGVRVEHTTRPGRVTLRDYDFRRPRFPLFASSPTPAPGEEGEYDQYFYRPSEMLAEASSADGGTPVADDLAAARFSQARGASEAQRRLDALRHDKRRVSFRTNAFDLAPGSVVALLDHPRSDLGADHPLLVLGTVFSGDIGEEWSHLVEGTFASHPYRPPRETPKPRVLGTQSAIVVGPEGEEIYVDEFGRVRVQFHWDRHGGYDPESSIWMRVSQGWSGTGWGMMVIPRVGHEVLVDFLDGDVDSPIIVGRVYNALQRVPYKLPDHKTVSCWRTDTTPGGDGNNYNEIKFEDQKERELIYVQAERDRAKLIKEDESVLIGRDRTSVVRRDEITAVQHDRTKVVHRDEHSAIGQDRIQQVRRDEGRAVGRDDTTVVVRDRTLTVGKSDTTNVVTDRTSRVGNYDKTFVGSRMTLRMAPGMGESVADGLGEVLDTPVGDMLGPVSGAPSEAAGSFSLRDSALNALSDFLARTSRAETPILRHLQGSFRRLDPFMPRALGDVLALAASPTRRLKAGDGMPAQATHHLPPTEIDMVNRKIRLTTGQATITLDGPDIRIEADREISLVSNGRIKLTSVADDVALYGGPHVKLNPGRDGDRPHRDRKGQPPVAMPAPVTAAQRATGPQRAAIEAALNDNDVDLAIDLTVRAMNIDVSDVASLQYAPHQGPGGTVDIDGHARVGRAASPAGLASSVVHLATMARLARTLRDAGHTSWPPGEDAARAAEARAYEAELAAAPNTGLDEQPEERAHVERQHEAAKEGMTPEARASYDAGELPS